MDKKNLKTFFSNFSSLSINQVVNIIVALIVTPVLFQTLGDSNYGYVRLSFSISLILSIIISFGFNLNGPKKISILTDSKSKQNLINDILSIRLFLAIIITLIVSSIIFTTDIFEGYKLILFFSLALLFVEALNPIFYLQGKNNISIYSLVNATSKLIYTTLIIILIKNPNDSYLVNLLFGSSAIIVNLFFWILFFYKNKDQIKFRFTLISRVKARFKENIYFFSSSFGENVSVHSSLIILEFFVISSQIGQFALAHRVAFFIRKLPVFIIQSILQNATTLNIKKNFDLTKFLNYFYVRGLFISLSCALFIAFFSKNIIFYLAGENILFSHRILLILSFIPFLTSLNIKNILIILIYDKKEVMSKSTWLSTAFMIIISLVLTYFFGGIGLAFAILISEFISFVIFSILLTKN